MTNLDDDVLEARIEGVVQGVEIAVPEAEIEGEVETEIEKDPLSATSHFVKNVSSGHPPLTVGRQIAF